MRLATVLVACLVTMPLSATSAGTDYTGIWKTDCSNYYGLQIKPVDADLCSVSLCGSGSCFEPGTWTPNTRIDGDPKYTVISPNELRTRRTDGGDSFPYRKCESDPMWREAEVSTADPVAERPKLPTCALEARSRENGLVIGWLTDVRETTQFGEGIETKTTRVGPFRPVALLRGSTITETSGSAIRKGQRFWRVLAPGTTPLRLRTVDSFLDYMNDPHCVYFGTFGTANPRRWTLLSSAPLPGVFRTPSRAERAEFARLNTTCIVQGDYPEDEAPPCTRPELLAVSDINKDRKPEYWATEPYNWDTGLSVWEEQNGKLVPLLQVCVGCSD